MPSVSRAQHNLMAAAAHNPSFARRAKIDLAVAKEFIAADKAKGKKAVKKLPKRKRTIASGY